MQRRWNSNGEISISYLPPSSAQVSQWPQKIFMPHVESSEETDNHRQRFDARALGIPAESTKARHYIPTLSITQLCLEGIIDFHVEEGTVFLEIAIPCKEDIWKQTCDEDRLYLWFELLNLVIFAFPDAYAESFWKTTQWRLMEVINSTIFPFLSVMEWHHLELYIRR